METAPSAPRSDALVNEDLEARQSRWGSLIHDLEDDWDAEDDAAPEADLRTAPGVVSAVGPSGFASRFGGGADDPTEQRCGEARTLNDWIDAHRARDEAKPMERSEWRKYLEASVRALDSLVEKIIGGHSGNSGGPKNGVDVDGDKIDVHPNFITAQNIIVQEATSLGGEEVGADFVEFGDSIFCNDDMDESTKTFLAMEALGRLSYAMFMLGRGPSLSEFRSHGSSLHEGKGGDGNVDEEDELMDMLRKNPRMTTSEERDSGIVSTMLESNVPFPLCRFVSDLLGDGEGPQGERSELSFSSFSDVRSDLKQMVDKPDAFLHASSPDRWKLSFGEKLYGRDKDVKAFMDTANRMATIHDDPLFAGLSALTGKRREVVMVSGHSGAGKSQLVRVVGTSLKKKGWRFLWCKFDRVVRPEPLSILAYAFDEFFGSLTSSEEGHSSSPKIQEIRNRLERIVGSEGLGMLAKHIPSLRLVIDDMTTTSVIEVTETEMHTLFGKLLQALSSEKTPLLFFIDDLQWADPLSLAMLSALVKGARPDLLTLASADNVQEVSREDDDNVLFVGTYRDNEVHEDHQLAKVLGKLEEDRSIHMTNISLSGLSLETLNEMLSETLSMPVRRVRLLSELVIQKTDGQCLHVIQFIQALAMDNLLTHSFARGWEWDADSIDICPITDSVAELFAFKLRRLPGDILLGLQILSCFGSQIDRHVLKFVAGYDGASSVDISASIDVAVREGLLERAAHIVSFSHDLIQKATIDSIREDDLVPLLRQLSAALIKNASAAGKLDSVRFVAVDLVNRIGSDDTPSARERELFANLNLHAGKKAISVPDFSGAARYAESGIAFLSDRCWETQYSLALGLYETAASAHFSCPGRDRDLLMQRIKAIFAHAKDFSDKFSAHCIWIKILSLTDLSRAIEESLNALERLGEPLDLANVGYREACNEVRMCKEQYHRVRTKEFSSTRRLGDVNKARAMKIMSSLLVYFHQSDFVRGVFVSCQMLRITMEDGHCGDSVLGLAAFANALVNGLEDIEEGTAWGRTALSLMELYDRNVILPATVSTIYGLVLAWKEPIQSTLEPVAEGVKLAFETGNVEFAQVNTAFYASRSFVCGKSIRVLAGEVEALTNQHSNYFDDSCPDKPSPMLEFWLAPLYNTLCRLEGERDRSKGDNTPSHLEQFRLKNTDVAMATSMQSGKVGCFHTLLLYQTTIAFLFRDMKSALNLADLWDEHFMTKDILMQYIPMNHLLYQGLITLHFMRETGKESYLARGTKALQKMEEWSAHSDWNFRSKVCLMRAEWHRTRKDYDKAASCYESAIKAAHDHKFMHEEAMANDLAGSFFYDRGCSQTSCQYFLRSIECYEKWGAYAVAQRVKDDMKNKFDMDSMQLRPPDTVEVPVVQSKEPCSKKRQMSD